MSKKISYDIDNLKFKIKGVERKEAGDIFLSNMAGRVLLISNRGNQG